MAVWLKTLFVWPFHRRVLAWPSCLSKPYFIGFELVSNAFCCVKKWSLQNCKLEKECCVCVQLVCIITIQLSSSFCLVLSRLKMSYILFN